ncbi:hypothetical protein [Oleiharenicola sp. Vm1]|uniref:hypothetical protein n=1 Tax=Oleiharenicola sp. Vm1 TaxID=3398393 RepID=UPI0039F4E753
MPFRALSSRLLRSRWLPALTLAAGAGATLALVATERTWLPSFDAVPIGFLLGVGAVSTLGAAALVWAIVRAHRQSVVLAERMTNEMTRREAQLRFILNALPMGVSWVRQGSGPRAGSTTPCCASAAWTARRRSIPRRSAP